MGDGGGFWNRRCHDGVLWSLVLRRHTALVRLADGGQSHDAFRRRPVTLLVRRLNNGVHIASSRTQFKQILELEVVSMRAGGRILVPADHERWIGVLAMPRNQQVLPRRIDIWLAEQSNDDFGVVPIGAFQTFVVVRRNMIASFLPVVQQLATEAAAPGSPSSTRINFSRNLLGMCALLASVCITVMGAEVSFGIQDLVAVRARVLSLLLMVALFVHLPVVLSGESFVAGSAVISLLDFQLAFSLPGAGFLCWHYAVPRSLVGG
jgi:hypothetical protein